MLLKHLSLQNFRSYRKAEFDLNHITTFIVGPNTSGKTNLLEAIYFLSTGKSFRAEKDSEAIRFGEELSRIQGTAYDTELEIVLTNGLVAGVSAQQKKFLVNGVAKRRVDFAGILPVVLFAPTDLEIIIGSPSRRRQFLDDVLEQVDHEYRRSLLEYSKSIRQRNALLEKAKLSGIRNKTQFEYWDGLAIRNGQIITKKREELIGYLNTAEKTIFDFTVLYDKSTISRERLLQYQEQETGAGVTLVGPHRDDFRIHMYNNARNVTHDVHMYGSRGQQRLVVLQMKTLQLSYMENVLEYRPLLVLDDIFSELDEGHISLIFELIGKQQTIITTTHGEFIPKKEVKRMTVVKLKLP